MLPNLTTSKISIVCGRTDLRKWIDGLATLAQEEYDLDVFDQSLFSFAARKMNASRRFTETVTAFSYY